MLNSVLRRLTSNHVVSLACIAPFMATMAQATPQLVELVPISKQPFSGSAHPDFYPSSFKSPPTGQSLAFLRGRIDPVSPHTSKNIKPLNSEKVEHISIVLVGDTGYAPSRARPLPKGVYKYGRWQTFAQTTQRIRREINGDINFANIESVISDSVRLRPFPKKYNFITHPNGTKHLVKAGFNLFSMANNHSFDYGAEGVRHSWRHAEALKSHGLLAHAGIGLNRKQAAAAPVFTSKNTKFSFAAIGIGAGGGGIQRASDKRPGQLSLNIKSDLNLITENLKTAPADYRMLSIHRGPERYIRPSAHEMASVRSLVRQGDVDLMIGHHAHVSRGIEEMNGRLIVYGLGNFLHQGTANMNGKGGCQNYSLMVRVHLTRRGNERPKLAAVEALPINSTHMQTSRIKGRQGAKRIAVLNGLARQFDNQATGSRGVRFVPQTDGSGLYCKAAAIAHPATRALCGNYAPTQLASSSRYSRALATCGGNAPTKLFAKPRKGQNLVLASLKSDEIKQDTSRKSQAPKAVTVMPSKKPKSNGVVKPKAGETYAQKRARWKRKEYTPEEVAAWKRHVAKNKLRVKTKKKRKGQRS